jgi:uncharacterized metal-binding protein YceD (DUF177 family)
VSAPEFSRRIPLARLGAEPLRQSIAASEAERTALARRFDLLGLDRLDAEVELTRRSRDLVLLRATFEAAFVQECVVTLDPIDGALAGQFSLLYGPPEAEEEAAGAAEDEIAFEPLAGDAIDIGEAVAQEFSLSLPSFPRSPDAAIESESAASPGEAGPFAALSRLLPRRDD